MFLLVELVVSMHNRTEVEPGLNIAEQQFTFNHTRNDTGTGIRHLPVGTLAKAALFY